MILRVEFRDRDANSGAAGRRAQALTLEAESARDLEALGELAALLTSLGATTTEAVRELAAKARPAAKEVPDGCGYG